jgi:hypothetical protein
LRRNRVAIGGGLGRLRKQALFFAGHEQTGACGVNTRALHGAAIAVHSVAE